MQRLITAILFLLTVSTSVSAQWFDWQTPGIPRTADGRADLSAPAPRSVDGHPDLTGLWLPVNASGSLYDIDNVQGWALDAMTEQQSTYK